MVVIIFMMFIFVGNQPKPVWIGREGQWKDIINYMPFDFSDIRKVEIPILCLSLFKD